MGRLTFKRSRKLGLRPKKKRVLTPGFLHKLGTLSRLAAFRGRTRKYKTMRKFKTLAKKLYTVPSTTRKIRRPLH